MQGLATKLQGFRIPAVGRPVQRRSQFRRQQSVRPQMQVPQPSLDPAINSARQYVAQGYDEEPTWKLYRDFARAKSRQANDAFNEHPLAVKVSERFEPLPLWAKLVISMVAICLLSSGVRFFLHQVMPLEVPSGAVAEVK